MRQGKYGFISLVDDSVYTFRYGADVYSTIFVLWHY